MRAEPRCGTLGQSAKETPHVPHPRAAPRHAAELRPARDHLRGPGADVRPARRSPGVICPFTTTSTRSWNGSTRSAPATCISSGCDSSPPDGRSAAMPEASRLTRSGPCRAAGFARPRSGRGSARSRRPGEHPHGGRRHPRGSGGTPVIAGRRRLAASRSDRARDEAPAAAARAGRVRRTSRVERGHRTRGPNTLARCST